MKKEFVVNAVVAVVLLSAGALTAWAMAPSSGTPGGTTKRAEQPATNTNSFPCTQTQTGNGAHGLGGSTATCSTNNGDTQSSGSNAAPRGGGSGSTELGGPGASNQGCNGDPSGHSDSGNGANYDGPYESVCPSGPSLNGNGKGNAVGKPCAGCVGSADDKQPRGQLPGGNDANAGYECDRNH